MIVKNERYIPTLDGWRAIAILAVLICHGLTPLAHNPKLHALLSLGAFGVQIFFCISGFLITTRLINEFELNNKISYRHFYIRRFFRILPPAIAYIILIYSLHLIGLFQLESKSVLGSLFFFKNFAPDNSWYLSHFWSLSVEEQFYFIWPLLLFLFSIYSGLILGIILFLATSIISINSTDLSYQYILSGCAMAYLLKKEGFKNYIPYLSKYISQLVLIVLFALGILNKLPFREIWLPIVIIFLITGTITNSNNLFAKILEFKLLKKIGIYSYSIYLWQQLFLIQEAKFKFWDIMQSFPINFTLVLIFSIISHNIIEKPLINYGRKKFAK